MKLVLFITLLETLALTLWMVRRWLSGDVHSRTRSALPIPPISHAADNKIVDGVSAQVDVPHWAFINEWQLESQSDDRSPMIGSVANGLGQRPAAGRAFARRSHQVNYKKWTKERHD